MFRVDRDRDAEKVEWLQPRPDVPEHIFFIEGWPDVDPRTGTVHQRYRSDWLLDSEIDLWLRYEGRFSPPKLRHDGAHNSNGFRLLLCERAGSAPPRLPISKTSFNRVERAFGLSPLTLSALLQFGGAHAKQYQRHPKTKSIESVNLVIKTTAKYEVSNALLSLNHNFTTKWTTAFWCDQCMFYPPRHLYNREPYHQIEHAQYIKQIIKDCATLWTSPLFLPTVLLQDYCKRAQTSQATIDRQVTRLEEKIGITSAGRSDVTESLDTWPAGMDFKGVTVSLHSAGAQLVFMTYVSAWACDMARFLLDVGNEIRQELNHPMDVFEPIKDQLEYLLGIATSSDRFLHGYRERLQAQTNVLYSAISQRDSAESINFARLAQQQSELSIKLTKLTKRDSVAMTAFTFITALFLPGTAVATLFSMPMFGWGDPPTVSSDSVSVTANFWIYWVVTGPLTVVVMAGWFAWYFFKNSQWEKENKEDLRLETTTEEDRKDEPHTIAASWQNGRARSLPQSHNT